MIIEEFIGKEIDSLDRSIVATPETRKNLDAFAKANQGSMDVVLTQMAVQYGYKLALQNVSDELKQITN
jgi:hypothetical protein|tara:strand:- start:258 stop:464 length:207 start_codon:yes stop_codon:yes gene_type:complete